MRSGDWKYVKIGEQEFLFNLATDDKEEIDLQVEHIDTFKLLRAGYQKWDAELEPYL